LYSVMPLALTYFSYGMTVYRTLAVFTVEVVGCASTRLQGCRGVGRQGNDLLDALVLEAVFVAVSESVCSFGVL
jgi:hypothetical protein